MNPGKNIEVQKADYGQDMKSIFVIATVFSFACLSPAIWFFSEYIMLHKLHMLIFAVLSSLGTIFFIFMLISGRRSSKLGKLILRDKLINCLRLNGAEQILDVGCGNGLLAIAAAKKLQYGKAVGIDNWDQTLEYKYSEQNFIKNAAIEHVLERIEAVTGDAQKLPFDDNSFDIVMTSLMMHHVPDKQKAIAEMLRVLKPSGTLLIADVAAKRYLPLLRSAEIDNISVVYVTRLFLVRAYILYGIKSKL
jgi:arsenite methyltransferase